MDQKYFYRKQIFLFWILISVITFVFSDCRAEGNWEDIGSFNLPGFEAFNPYIKTTFNSQTGEIYTAFSGATDGGRSRAWVMKNNGSSWVSVGNPGLDHDVSTVYDIEVNQLTGEIFLSGVSYGLDNTSKL
jgi:hypothetical protein